MLLMVVAVALLILEVVALILQIELLLLVVEVDPVVTVEHGLLKVVMVEV